MSTQSKTFDRALSALRRPDAKLLRQHGGSTAGLCVRSYRTKVFAFPTRSATKLLERNDIQPFRPVGCRSWAGRNPGGSAIGESGRGDHHDCQPQEA